ncbi:MAG: trypsin-like serine protease [Paracoccaceae bacterium]|nr:trypsin-like serine protease [Paracoccaceae bacterium]
MFRFILLALITCATHASAAGVAGVGRIEDQSTSGTCTAVLIRPDVIMTAAHCVADGPSDRHVFRLGSGVPSDPVSVTRFIRYPLYEPTHDRVVWRLRFDLAVGKLAEPIDSDRASPFDFGTEAVVGEDLFLVSWRNDGRSRPRQRSCPVITNQSGLVTLGCEVRGGESGSPLFRLVDGERVLVAIISSRSTLLTQPIANASDVYLRLPPLLDALEKP